MHFFIKKEKHDKSQKLRAMTTKNPKQYWKYLNSLKSKGKPTEPISLDDLYNYFKQISSNDVEDESFSNMDIITQNQNISNQNMYLNSEITEQEINYCINNLKNSKAASPFDNIINEYIKSTKHLILPLYYKLFNCVLKTGFIPTTC